MDNQTGRLARQRWWLMLTYTLSWLVWLERDTDG